MGKLSKALSSKRNTFLVFLHISEGLCFVMFFFPDLFYFLLLPFYVCKDKLYLPSFRRSHESLEKLGWDVMKVR